MQSRMGFIEGTVVLRGIYIELPYTVGKVLGRSMGYFHPWELVWAPLASLSKLDESDIIEPLGQTKYD